MGRKSSKRTIWISMNGYSVGLLTRLSPGALTFQYDSEWLARTQAVPISLSMPLSRDPYSGELVWRFFDNLLPDNPGIRERLQGVLGSDSTRPFDLLEGMGTDCVGALQLSPQGNKLPNSRVTESRVVSRSWIADRLRHIATRPLGMSRDDDFRISIAGAQEKTALLRYRGKWQEPIGATPTSHIFKLPIGPTASGIDLADSVENEWLCLRIAKAFGLPVPAAKIEQFEECKTLIVERFDRKWSRDKSWLMRLPQEDACQALGYSTGKKYESDGGPGVSQILDLLLQSQDAVADRALFFRTLVVFWLLAAIDGHAKNFSLFLLPGGQCRMTPIYDILSAHPIVAQGQLHKRELNMAMAMSGKNRHYGWEEIQGRHFISTAKQARFSESMAASILKDCKARGGKVISSLQNSLPPEFPRDVADPIFKGIETTLLRI